MKFVHTFIGPFSTILPFFPSFYCYIRLVSHLEIDIMPRVSKKAAQRRRAGGLAVEVRAQKRQKLDLESSTTEDNGWQSDAPSEGMLTEEEDQYPIGQPKAGREEAERTLGYSKTKELSQT